MRKIATCAAYWWKEIEAGQVVEKRPTDDFYGGWSFLGSI